MGRERFAGYLAEFLTGAGYAIERIDTNDPAESTVKAHLTRMNPAVPDGAKEIELRLYPNSGGAFARWVLPATIPEPERARLDRFVRELVQAVERAVATESHATAKVTRPPSAHLPWEAPA
ncbi:MAG: hypothetical protein L3K19_04625 [Thermoplasmata archaeon]|nr:hypothetical protein [Thermoplasmata archaeon]